MNGLELKKNRKKINLTQEELAKKIGVSKNTIYNYEKGGVIPKSKQGILQDFFDSYKTKEVVYSKENKNLKTETSELTKKKYEGKTLVRIVSTKAQAGWSDAYYSEEYLQDMPEVLIESDENYKGNYLAFEVEGESMEPDYYAGDIVICREVQRHLWSYKLHYKDWDFVIAHGTKGIMLKEITNHNIETGEIVCHSLHPNHDDFSLNLREVAFLYNVVEVRQKGRSKRRNR